MGLNLSNMIVSSFSQPNKVLSEFTGIIPLPYRVIPAKALDCFATLAMTVFPRFSVIARSFASKQSRKAASSFFSVYLLFLLSSPLYGQSFETLLDELSGSQADQLESEISDLKKQEDYPAQPSSTEIITPPEEDTFAPEKNIVTNGVTLQGLDKQTARVFIMDAPVLQPIEFGTLKITVRHCEKAPLDDRQESMAFVTISENQSKGPPINLFSGWMFSSSPALSALDHPTYDIWIKECKTVK